MKTKSVMTHRFSEIPNAEIPRSRFDRSHGYKTTFDAGNLVPILVDEALPGDTFNVKMTGFARMATPLHPIMDNLFMDTFFFAVPVRLLWDNWKRFNGEQTTPGDSTDYVVPQIASLSTGYAEGTIFDYMGLPTGVNVSYNHCAFPCRAYNLIYNEWFRDQNLQDPAPIFTDDGNESYGNYPMRKRGKRHDYFTSCLPWPQKGDSVSLPLGQSAPVIGEDPNNIGANNPQWNFGQNTVKANTGLIVNTNPLPSDTQAYWTSTGLAADLTDATAITINQLREAFQIQRMLERDARGGTRYTEIIRAHFGVTSPDARLQRPEYLGGGTSPINVHAVPQTSETNTTPQGNLSAYGTATMHNHGFTKSFTEHSIIIGLVNVRADLTYQQGLNRMWSRETRYDFYWPALSHLGEQAVLSKEIYLDGTASDNDVFGYQERFAEYRYKPSMVTGKFRSSDPQSLDTWHLSQDFATRPVLSNTFIEENPPIDRTIAVPSEPHFLLDAYFSMNCARPMPIYGTPGLIDHF